MGSANKVSSNITMKTTNITILLNVIWVVIVLGGFWLFYNKGWKEGFVQKLSSIPPKEISILAEKKRCDEWGGEVKIWLSSKLDGSDNYEIKCLKSVIQVADGVELKGTKTLFEYSF